MTGADDGVDLVSTLRHAHRIAVPAEPMSSADVRGTDTDGSLAQLELEVDDLRTSVHRLHRAVAVAEGERS